MTIAIEDARTHLPLHEHGIHLLGRSHTNQKHNRWWFLNNQPIYEKYAPVGQIGSFPREIG